MPFDSMLSNYFHCRRDCTIKRSEIRTKMSHPQANKNSKDAREGMRVDLKITCRKNIVNFFLPQEEEVGQFTTYLFPSFHFYH